MADRGEERHVLGERAVQELNFEMHAAGRERNPMDVLRHLAGITTAQFACELADGIERVRI